MNLDQLPNPGAYRNINQWAQAVYGFFTTKVRLDERNNPLPLILPHRSGDYDERASEDGILLYDPLINKVVVSIGGQFVPIFMEGDVDVSQFSELLVTQRTPLIELQAYNTVDIIRDVVTTTNSGSVTTAGGEYVLSTGATASAEALLESAEAGRYVSGFAAEVGMGIRFPDAPTGNQFAEWGAVDKEDGPDAPNANGFLYRYDASGVSAVLLNDGVRESVSQANWNLDKLNGKGKSRLTLDLAKGNICQQEFTWYGYGDIVFQIVNSPIRGKQKPIPVHVFEVDGGGPSIANPNLYLFSKVSNGGDATNFTGYTAGRSYTVLGIYKPARRITSQNVTGFSTSTTRLPVMTFRRKADFLDRSIRVDGFDILATSEKVIMELVLNPTLTGASYSTPTNHVASACAVEVDTSATAMSGGHVLYSQVLPAGKQNDQILSGPGAPLNDLEIPRRQPVTLSIRTVSGTGTADATLRMREEH